ncbi:tRNA modification GTPase GTPBP3, mitochondrial-like [Oscarella lobularis]|uniref:tRNA modification GTPase GTPBP3, mitochondrial-like n=1 Tax=Oscarella lobularis TaxID=121494 RepID=UPI0033136406
MDHLPQARVATLTKLVNPVTHELIDKAIALWFPRPNSFTGEDVVEYHVHGSIAVLSALTDLLQSIKGIRYAEPGEFTKRAFLNGKFDLTEVEGLADLINAETEVQRRQALRQMEGHLSKVYSKWTNSLAKCLAYYEATIDFGESEDIEDNILDKARVEIKSIIDEIRTHLRDARRGERLRSGVRLAIVGEPNVGKSSLLNILSERPAAIVSPVAGTTRDVIETALNIAGYPVIVSDTAGLRKTNDPVEREGVKRAIEKAENADLILVVIDSSCLGSLSHFVGTAARLIVVANKIDLRSPEEESYISSMLKNEAYVSCSISCTTSAGIDHLLQLLESELKKLCGDPLIDSPSLTRSRHRKHLRECVECLDRSQCAEMETVLAAEEVRLALTELGRITGKVGTEDILDIIFDQFCIGK